MTKEALFAFIFGLCLLPIGSCANGPQIRVHVSDPASGGMQYFDEKTSDKGFILYKDTDNYVCFTPSDAQALLSYCGGSKK